MAYFENSKKGELQELSEDLNSLNYDKKKDAVKKVIAYMTVGKDVSPLFQQVIKCLEYEDIELKKLVFLYVLNYSRQKPDDAIMVINLFRRDANKKENPILRALAVRSFGCIRVPKLNEYLMEPLKEALNDDDAYVRKTAVLCVPKVYECTPELTNQSGLLDILLKMLNKEGNALVLANLVCALHEISEIKQEEVFQMNKDILQKLLLAVNECIEWGQIFIMDYLTQYTPIDSKEAESIIERILPRLSHINPTVVFSAVKLIVKYLDFVKSVEIVRNLIKKIQPSISSLLAFNQPEIQYTLLRNVAILMKKQPLLQIEPKVFFCSVTEPYYVKYEKLDILTKIINETNSEVILNELRIYLSEADPDFVRKTIKAIGQISLKYPKCLDKALSILLEQIQNIKESKVQDSQCDEILINLQLLLRKYHSSRVTNLQTVLKTASLIFDQVTESESKSSVAWIIGEFAEYLNDAFSLIQLRVETLENEDRNVQLQVLSAGVKIYLKFPDEGEVFIQSMLEKATEVVTNQDVRDRAFIYWRLLSIDPNQAKQLVFNDRPTFYEDTPFMNVDAMLDLLNSVSSTYNVNSTTMFKAGPPQTLSPLKQKKQESTEQSPSKTAEKIIQEAPQKQIEQEKQQPNKEVNLLDFEDTPQQNQQQNPPPKTISILESPNEANQPVIANKQKNDEFLDLFQETTKEAEVPYENLVNITNSPSGVIILGRVTQKKLELKITNNSKDILKDFIAQVKKNYLGLKLGGLNPIQITVGQTEILQIDIIHSSDNQDNQQVSALSLLVGLKTNIQVFYFAVPLLLTSLLVKSSLSLLQIQQILSSVPPQQFQLATKHHNVADSLKNNMFSFQYEFYQVQTINGISLLSQIRQDNHTVHVKAWTTDPNLIQAYAQGLNFIFNN